MSLIARALIPARSTPSTVAGVSAGWLRCRVVEPEQGQPFYSESPTARVAEAFTVGDTTPAEHAETLTGTPLGESAGIPGQRFTAERAPVLTDPGPAGGGAAAGGRVARRLLVLAVVAAGLAGAYLLYPLGRWAVQDVPDKLSTPAPIQPSQVHASTEVPGHPANAAVDGLKNRYWGAPQPGSWIDCTFSQPFRLVSVLITPGPSTKQEEFTAQARPTDLEITTTDVRGRTTTRIAPVPDRPGPQQINTGISGVKHVRVQIRGSSELGGGKHIAIAELEFFRRP